jgi:hypothetical protein
MTIVIALLLAGVIGVGVAILIRLVKLKQYLRARPERMQRDLIVATLLASPRYCDPRHLAHFETQAFSQHGEDGIISEILRRIGATNRRFVEIGSGDGRENNTTYRLTQGWSGHWFEGDPVSVERIKQTFATELADQRLRLVHSMITAENIAGLMQQSSVPTDFDLLSLDIDRNTSYVWRALANYKPRIVVIEYNASIPRDDEWEVEYRANEAWDGSMYFGAGLKTFEAIGAQLGYALVACELSGSNAFFVRKELVDEQFVGPFTASMFYEPPRYYLLGARGWRARYGRSSSARIEAR